MFHDERELLRRELNAAMKELKQFRARMVTNTCSSLKNDE